MRLTLAPLGVALALVLTTTGCGGDDSTPEADPSSATATPSAASTPSGSSTETVAAKCAVPGFVGTDTEKVTGGRAVAVYVSARGMAPSSTSSGTGTLGGFDLTPMRVSSPLGEVPVEIRRSVFESVGAPWRPGGLPEQSGPHRFSLRNDTSRNQLYVLYRGADLLKGTWSAERCGSPYNDGKEVVTLSGKFSALTPVRRLRVYQCGSEPADRFDRAASRVCRL